MPKEKTAVDPEMKGIRFVIQVREDIARHNVAAACKPL